MNNVHERNVVRKISSIIDAVKQENTSSFRKSVTERLSTPLKENFLERIPGHDTIYFK